MRLKIILFGVIFLYAHLGEATIYRWKDKKGNIHLTDNYDKIPPQYRSQLKVSHTPDNMPSINRTVIKFRREGSSIFVNATLNYNLPVVFHLDTGATNTMILEEDAVNLGLNLKNASHVRSRIADGSTVSFPMVRLSSIQIGKTQVRDIKVMVGKVRLLGLNFLKKFKVTVDSQNENLILEAPEREMMVESESVRAEKKKAMEEYELKIDKAKLQIEAIQKNIELLDIQIDEYREKSYDAEDKLREAVEHNASQSRIDRIESVVRQYNLAIESRQLNQETYNKDIDMLNNNIEFYQQQVRKLR